MISLQPGKADRKGFWTQVQKHKLRGEKGRACSACSACKNLPSSRHDIQDGQTGQKLRNTNSCVGTVQAGGTANEDRQVDRRVAEVGRYTRG